MILNRFAGKIRKTFFFLPVLFSIFAEIAAQNEKDYILFRGVVMDAGVLSPLPGTNISINRNLYGVSEKDGSFNFAIRRGDTVSFARVGFKPTLFSISDTLAGNEFISGVYMHQDTISIGEVIILPGLRNLKNELINAKTEVSANMENARNNVALAAYQGKNNQNRLGDPASNYAMLRQIQKVDAYEKGGIPSDRIAAISPLMLIPVTYMLLNGLPPLPAPFQGNISSEEIDLIKKKYMEIVRQQR